MKEKPTTKLCKHCKTEIPAGAKVCPNCRKKQGGPGCLIAIIVFIIVAIAIISSSGKEDDDPNKSQSHTQDSTPIKNSDDSNESSSTPVNTTEEGDGMIHVGEVLETSKLKVTYVSVAEYVSDNQFLQPKEGYKYIRYEFEIENISNSDHTLTSADFSCYADGYLSDSTYFNDSLSIDTISSGRKIKVALYYEVPSDAQEIELEFETSFWTQKKVVFAFE